MKITTRGRYALRMLVHLAEKGGEEHCSLAEIAEAEGISKKYLEQIVPLLTKADILQANRGLQGGYRLARTPQSLSVGEVMRLTEGEISPVECFGPGGKRCPNTDCSALPVWQGLSQVIYDYLDGISLADLVNGKYSA